MVFPGSDSTPVSAARDLGAMLLAALPDSPTLRLSLRDSEGRFVAVHVASENLAVTSEAGIGRTSWPGGQYLAADGRERAMIDHPAQLARITGIAQTGECTGIRFSDGEERWYIGDFIPVGAGPAGREVLSVLMEVTDLQLARRDAEARAAAYEQVLGIAALLAGRRYHPADLAAALRPPLAGLLPNCQIGISLQHLDSAAEVTVFPIEERPGLAPFPHRLRITHQMRQIWARGTHVDNDVQPTDIYGVRVIGTDPVPVRSACLVPIRDTEDALLGMLVVYSQRPRTFEDALVAALEHLGRLVGPLIDPAARRLAA